MFLYFFSTVCVIILLLTSLSIYLGKATIRFIVLAVLLLGITGAYLLALESFGSALRMDLELIRIPTKEVKILYYHIDKGNIYYLLNNNGEIRYYYEILSKEREKQLRQARAGKKKIPKGLRIKSPFRGNYFINRQLQEQIRLYDKPPQEIKHPLKAYENPT